MQRQKRFDEKLLLILERASGIFAEKGYHNASVRDVAAATGVSPAGLYYYFKSKEELLHLILDACLSTLLNRIRQEVAGIEDPAVRLRVIVRTHLDHLNRYRNQMRVLVHEWHSLTGRFGDEIRGLMKEYVRIVIFTFRELSPGKDQKELRAATFGLIGMLSWVDQWYRPKKDLPMHMLADRFSSIFLGEFLEEAKETADTAPRRRHRFASAWSEQDSASSILSGPGF
jgi:AcrR family transcriptional regulator